MGIDRIGKGGGLPPTPDTSGVSGPQQKGGAERPFKVDRAEGATQTERAGAAAEAGAASPLARLRAGEIDVNGYVDLKVDEATRNLKGLSPGEIDEIKRVLRDQMATDPGLADLVRTATGQTPSVPED